MKNKMDIDIPVEKYCSIKQACEYLAFDWEPVSIKYEAYLDRKHFRPDEEQPFWFYESMKKAENTLAVLIDQNKLSITGIEDPAFPVPLFDSNSSELQKDVDKIHKRHSYDPKKFNKRTKVKTEYPWELDLEENWLINVGGISYREIQIPFAELQALAKNKQPKKHYTANLNDEGYLTITDGTITCTIAHMRPGDKKFQWLKFYFDKPNKPITKDAMIKAFKGTGFDFQDGDRMTNPIHSAFGRNPDIMHACFPILSDKQIVCSPEFTDIDLQHE